MAKTAKIFVLDTNVLLHDHDSFKHFQENDLVIPIVVLEELDKFKKGNNQINFNAREFARELDKILGDRLLSGWIPIGPDKGKLKVELGHPYPDDMTASFVEDTPDHRILNTTLYIKNTYPDRKVTLVSKDVNLRIKAKALGVHAADYLSDKVQEEHIESFGKGVVTLNRIQDKIMAGLYQTPQGVPVRGTRFKSAHANQYFILKNSKGTALARYNASTRCLLPVERRHAYGIEPRNNEQILALDALLDPSISLVSLTGIAGTGKTLLALAAALEQEDRFKQILLSRPVIPLQNQEMGFLPGNVQEKLAPYMLPLMDNLKVIKNRFKDTSRENIRLEEMQRSEKLLISPLAYIRGRSLNQVFFIIDEAQNLTPHEVKTIITRAGEGSKLVFTGDIQQIDSPYLDMHSNGLTTLTDKMIGQDLFAHVNLVKGERSRLAELAGKIL